jgi:hypothetical protein
MPKTYSCAMDYKKIMDHIVGLPSCTLITTGRTGTDFLQSLLDSHTEVLTFNGSLFFSWFWRDSYCVKVPDINLDDLLDEFIGKQIQKLKSRYDWIERKDRLGENADEVLDIDLAHFKKTAIALMHGRTVNSTNVLLAIYGAYSICLGQEVEKKTIFFHHVHHAEELGFYLDDFPDSKIICMTRDPRANFVSGIQNWRKHDQLKDSEDHLLYYIERILLDAYVLEKYDNDYIVMRIEDLGKRRVLDEMCDWLGISYENQLAKSTWGGMMWRGDRVSSIENEGGGWSAKMLNNSWEQKLSLTDKYLFNFLMNSRLKFYGYPYRKNNVFGYLIVPILILFPLSFEFRFFSLTYIRAAVQNGGLRVIVKNSNSYFKRVLLFYRYYVKTVGRFKFARNFISGYEFEVHEIR